MDLKNLPKILKAFRQHGVDFTNISDEEYIGSCIFCDKPNHFYANGDTGQWQCKRCGEKGNLYSFLNLLFELYAKTTSKSEWTKLSNKRGISIATLKRWGLVFDEDWLIPSRNIKGKLQDVRVYSFDDESSSTISTTACKVCLFGSLALADAKRKNEPVYICEGEFDAMALSMVLKKLGKKGIPVGLPGAGIFKKEWIDWVANREVILVYDNDKAGDDGSERAAKMLEGSVESIKYLCWPYSKPNHYDLNDLVKDSKTCKTAWNEIQSALSSTHRRQQSEQVGMKIKKKKVQPIEFPELMATYEKWLKLNDDLRMAIKIMLATTQSTYIPKNPVWLFIVGPASGGKTTLLETLRAHRQTYFLSSLSRHSLVSGFRAEGGDPSILPKLNGKAFILKDYTEVLRMGLDAKEEIWSTLRGAYDGSVKKTFGNGVVRDYTSHFTILAGVTNEIHGNGQASIGERFLKFQIMKKTAFSSHDESMLAMSNIGLENKRENQLQIAAAKFLKRKPRFAGKDSEANNRVMLEMVPIKWQSRIATLGDLVGLLRAQVARDPYRERVIYRPQQEAGSRLTQQLMRLALGLVDIQGLETMDKATYAIIERVALDTAIGFHMDVLQAVMMAGGSSDRKTIGRDTGLPDTNVSRHLEDLTSLQVLRRKEKEKDTGFGVKFEYEATPYISKLWAKAGITIDHRTIEAQVDPNRDRGQKPRSKTKLRFGKKKSKLKIRIPKT